MILLYTDGITEARNVAGELFGNSRLVEALKGRQSESVATLQRHLRGGVETWSTNCPQSDDIPLLTFRYRELRLRPIEITELGEETVH